MKGYNTKTRYQVKLLLAVAALALFYESSGWSVIMSAAAGIYMFVKGKKESVKNLWWMSLSAISFMISLLLTISFYMNEVAGVKISSSSLSPDKCHLVQQCLACTLVASIVSSVFSEKPDAGAEEGEETDAKTSGRMFTKKADGDKKKSTAAPVKKVEEPKKKVVAVDDDEDEDEEDAVVVEAAAKKEVETPEMKEETLAAAVEGQ